MTENGAKEAEQGRKEEEARFAIQIRPDRMAVHLEITYWPRGGDQKFGVAALREELSQRKVVFGYDDATLEQAVAEVRRLAATGGRDKILLAQGRPAVDGGNGRLEYRVGEGAVNSDPAGADLVRPGQVIVARIAAESGTPGQNVFGEEVAPRPGHEPSLAVGENVRLDDEGRSYLAEIYGRATVAGGLVAVSPLVEIAGDGMSAWLPISPKMADGSLLQVDDLLHSLKVAGVVHGVSEGAIRAVLEQEVALPRFLVAKGDPPVDGRDAEVNFAFTLNEEDPLRIDRTRQAGKIASTPLRKSLLLGGETVAEKKPAVPALPGRRVTGESFGGREPRDIPLVAGENVVEVGEGPTLVVDNTLVAGYADYRAGVVTVIDPLQVSEDEMRAVLEVHPPDGQGRRLTGELLLKLLADHRVTHGVRKETIRRAVDHAASKRQVLRVVAAVGREPVDGDDAAIEVLVRAGKSAGRIMQPTDSIDFRERDAINSVKKGEELARRTPPEPGVDGWTVRGIPLPAKPGTDIQFQPQPNVVIRDDGLSLLSDIDGMVTILADNKIAVFSVYEVKGDVDYRVGNLDMAGSLIISGWVRPGFTLKASGEIRVGGGVEDATLISGGDILVSGGVLSRGQGRIRSGGDLQARFLEWTRVHAGGNILVRDQIMRSHVFACGTVDVTAGLGRIRGGVVSAIHGVEANEIGSPAGVRTVVMVGVNPALRRRQLQVERQLAAFARQRAKLDTVLGRWLNHGRQGARLPPETQGKLSRLAKQRRALVQSEQRLERPRRELARELAAIDPLKVRVSARKAVFAGTVVVIGRIKHRVREDLARPVVFRLDGERREVALE
ncbi:flagellar assembly protein A [Desulfurivibrio sp. D14AmB]|uniref:flagellar assembly protein A n=1 Tax=Desulfurivibrio sp. D14AmB TaxID=3374370 RepID=UPI00376F291D